MYIKSMSYYGPAPRSLGEHVQPLWLATTIIVQTIILIHMNNNQFMEMSQISAIAVKVHIFRWLVKGMLESKFAGITMI